MNLVDNYFNEYSVPLKQQQQQQQQDPGQEPLITPLHLSVDPSVEFAIGPDEIHE